MRDNPNPIEVGMITWRYWLQVVVSKNFNEKGERIKDVSKIRKDRVKRRRNKKPQP